MQENCQVSTLMAIVMQPLPFTADVSGDPRAQLLVEVHIHTLCSWAERVGLNLDAAAERS